MLNDILSVIPPTRWGLDLLHRRRSHKVILPQIGEHIGSSEKVIDIGAGTCHVCRDLGLRGISVTPLDVKNHSLIRGIKPVVYDGSAIPFPDGHFDVALILTVLHHAVDQEAIVREAMRVAKRIIILEDIYESRLQKYVTWLFDCIGNLEFIGNPHTNRTDRGWLDLFSSLGLRVTCKKIKSSELVFTHALYCLEKESIEG